MLQTMPIRPRLQSATEKAAALFRACVNLASSPNRTEMQPVKALLSHLGIDVTNIVHDPNFNMLHRFVYLGLVYGHPAFIRFDIAWSYTHSRTLRIRISDDDEKWMINEHKRSRPRLIDYYKSLLVLYDPAIDTKALAERIIRVEVVAKNYIAEVRKRRWSASSMTLAKVGSYLKGYISEKEWTRLVSQATYNSFNEKSRTLLSDNLTAIVELFMDKNRLQIDDARLLMGWSVLRRIVPSASGKLMAGQAIRSHGKRADRAALMCYNRVMNVMPLAVSHKYFKTHVPPPAMAAARRVVTDVLRGLEGKINTTDWMRGPAWCLMRTKFKAMYFIFGYPDGLGSEHLIETLFEEIPDVAENFTAGFLDAKRQATINVFRKNFKISMNTAAIGAHYHPDTHEVYLSATLLQPPIFIHGAPAAFNYAGIGMIAGHELSHAFDPEDIEYDVNGYIKKFPDTPMMKEFTAKVLCLRNSYYQAESEERGARSMNPTIDNEGVVDYTGVLLSYEAYKRLPEHEREARIPDMDFTPDQIFFITYCLKWCTESKSNKRGPGTLHWAARSRCLVPLRNMPEFSQAFGCKKGDRMNPDTKCPFY
ncbi:neprilysin-2-like [Amblyomma americanum]